MVTIEQRVRDDFLMLNGLRFHYREWRDTAADAQTPALALLHGTSGHTRQWDRFAGDMVDRFRVLAFDLRGHGESAWADDYTQRRMEEDVDAFLAHFGLRRVALVGQSLGAAIAYLYTARHPGIVERLVISDAGPDTVAIVHAQPQGLAALRAAAEERFTQPEAAIANAIAANPRQPEEDVRHQTLPSLVQHSDGCWGYRHDAARLGEWFHTAPSEADQWASLAQITCPTLVLRGAESHLLSRATAERMAQTLPHGQWIEIPDSGHGIPRDNPAAFRDAIRSFLLTA